MEKRTFGKTGLEITRLGFGSARIGEEGVEEAQIETLLNTLLDIGINFVDTAACYTRSEELIGRFIGGRRDEYVLVTKCGHVTGGAEGEAWSREIIGESIDRSLRRLHPSTLGPRQPVAKDESAIRSDGLADRTDGTRGICRPVHRRGLL